MSSVEILSLAASVTSVALAVFSIWLAQASERRARESHEKTQEVLNQVDKRAAIMEQVVGEHFKNMMGTMLNIVNTTTTGPEERTKQLELRRAESATQMQMKIMEQVSEVIKSGDPGKVEGLVKVFQGITGMTKPTDPTKQ